MMMMMMINIIVININNNSNKLERGYRVSNNVCRKSLAWDYCFLHVLA